MMSLVEVVRPITASDETIAEVRAFAEACGKSPVEVSDRAGFIVNALLFPYLNNAVRMLENGTATRDDIDTAMKGGCNFPMGPLALLDLVGLDTSLAILDALYAEFRDPNYAAMPLLRRMVTAGQLGRKSGLGFYDYAVAVGRPPGAHRAAGHPLAFPPANEADEVGVVGVGADLEPGTLLAAYRSGLFPMPVEGGPRIAWWSPDPRGIIPLDGLRVSRSLRQACRHLEVRVDTAFDRVDHRLRRPRPRRRVDQPRRDRCLPPAPRAGMGPQRRDVGGRHAGGGLYGVSVGAMFAGESMFHLARDASKVALVALVERRRRRRRHAARRAVDDTPPALARRPRHRPLPLSGVAGGGRHGRRPPLRLTRPLPPLPHSPFWRTWCRPWHT